MLPSSSRTILLAVVLALSASARAQAPGPGAEPAPDSRAPVPQAFMPPGQQALAPQHTLDFADVAGDALLERSRGGDDRTTIDTKFTGSVNGNSATNVSTGWNVIEGGSFANMSGIPIIIQNSGANVLIQNATVINLQLK
jgi:hypothetical protein